jgi:hypothetical protein
VKLKSWKIALFRRHSYWPISPARYLVTEPSCARYPRFFSDYAPDNQDLLSNSIYPHLIVCYLDNENGFPGGYETSNCLFGNYSRCYSLSRCAPTFCDSVRCKKLWHKAYIDKAHPTAIGVATVFPKVIR